MALPDDLLRAIGRVAVNFQSLEMHVAIVTAGLVGPEQEVGQMVTAQLPFGKLCVLAEALFNYRFAKTAVAPKFAALITSAVTIEERRNQLLHSAWMTNDESSDVWRLKFALKRGSGLRHASPKVTAEEVNALADQIAETANGFLSIISDLDALGLRKDSK